MSVSCVYEGTIRHWRAEPAKEFTHRLALTYIDLDELPWLLGGRLVAAGPGALRFRRRDYLGARTVPLSEAVRDRVQELCGRRPAGPIRLLTQLRSFGVCFNPVSFYYCFDGREGRLDSVLAEVTNTPWGERHSYVLAGRDHAGVLSGAFAKQLHVSPFMGMDHRYEARATPPAATLSLHIDSLANATHPPGSVFRATLAMKRRELTRAAVAKMTARYPLATVRVLALIYGHALGLKLAGAPVHPHPRAAAR